MLPEVEHWARIKKVFGAASDLPPEARAELGITEGMLRLSLGLEHADDLVADLQQAASGV